MTSLLAGMINWTSLEIWQLIVTAAVGVATILVYISIRQVQKQEAKASAKLASIAELQNEKSEAKLKVIHDGRYPFRHRSAHNLASHPEFGVHLANTGWKDSDLLEVKVLLFPARDDATSNGSPHSRILGQGEPRDDLFLPAGRIGRFVISLEPQHLKAPFRLSDYHIAFEVWPVNGKSVQFIYKDSHAPIACPDDWAAKLAAAQQKPHP